jgi:hypothetical protein
MVPWIGYGGESMSLETAVQRALAEAGSEPSDSGAVELALVYAREIDAGEEVRQLGPLLLACLDALMLTPKARKAVLKEAKDDAVQSPLDELRARRAARTNRAQALDAAA